MRNSLRITLILTLLLALPAAGLADSVSAWTARLEMQAAPEDKALAALTDLLACLEADGAFVRSEDGRFALDLTFGVAGKPDSRTSLRLTGTDRLWVLTSPLLGDETLLFRNENMPEYFNKLQEHLGLPVAPLSLLNPYCTEAAVAVPAQFMREVMQPGEVPPETLAVFCALMAELSQSDRPYNWLNALGGDSALEETFAAFLEDLPAWLTMRAPDGITVVETELGTTWQITGDPDAPPLYTANPEGTEWTLSLPGAWTVTAGSRDDEEEPEADWEEDWEDVEEWDDALELEEKGDFFCQRSVTPDGGYSLILRAGIDGSDLDLALVVSDAYRVHLSGSHLAGFTVLRCVPGGSGPVIRSERLGGGAWDIALERNESGWVLTDLDSGLPYLRLRMIPRDADGALLAGEWTEAPAGTEFYSLNDASMAALIQRIAKPMAAGAVHLLAALPARPVADLLDWLEENNLLTEDASAFD